MKLHDGREVPTGSVLPGGRYNLYDCPGDGAEMHIEYGAPDGARVIDAVTQHSLLSLTLDMGVTPMFVTCPDHDKRATSRLYRGLVPADHLPLRMVWRRATNSELKRERREGGNHFAQGGLAREWVL